MFKIVKHTSLPKRGQDSKSFYPSDSASIRSSGFSFLIRRLERGGREERKQRGRERGEGEREDKKERERERVRRERAGERRESKEAEREWRARGRRERERE